MSLNNIKINNTTNVNTGVVYDISKATGQTYDTLADALGTDGSNVPSEVREGGMSVRFVHMGDNKYVQYFLMKEQWSANKADWKNLEEEVSQIEQGEWFAHQLNNYNSNLIFDFGELKVKNTQGTIYFTNNKNFAFIPEIPHSVSLGVFETDMIFPSEGYLHGVILCFLEKTPTDSTFVIRIYGYNSYPPIKVSYPRYFLGTLNSTDYLNLNSYVFSENTFCDFLPFKKTFIFRDGTTMEKTINSYVNSYVKNYVDNYDSIIKNYVIDYIHGYVNPFAGFYVSYYDLDGCINIDFENNKVIVPEQGSGPYLIDSFGNYYYINKGETAFVKDGLNGIFYLYYDVSDRNIYLESFSTYDKTTILRKILGQVYYNSNINELRYDAIPFTHKINGKPYKSLFSEDDIPHVPNLVGKKLSIMGDSISTYSGYIPSGNAAFFPRSGYDVDDVSYTWWKKLLDKTGMFLEKNESWSGSRIATPPAGRTEKAFTNSDRYNNLGNPDVIIVFGGINDEFAQSDPTTPGNFLLSTNGDFDLTQLKQAYQFLLKTLISTYQNAKIFICCPTFAGKNIFEDNAVGMSQIELYETVKRVADYYGVGFIDLSKCGISNYNYTQYLDDTVHPNRAGMQLIFEKVLGTLREYFI